MDKKSAAHIKFLDGGGDMGELIRHYDWSSNPLGPMDQWSESLRTTLGIVLHSAFPMFLFWGKDLICFYNDAFRPSLGINGKHPAIGKKGREVWSEIWDFIGPLIEQVMTTGHPVSYYDQLVPFYRNGRMEDIYWTFCYSAAYGSDGSITGLVVTCTETTEAMLTKKKLEESERRLRSMIQQAPVSIGIFRGPEYVTEMANSKSLAIWGRTEQEVINKPILETMPELLNQGFQQLLDEVYQTGKTFSASEMPVQINRNGELEIAYVNFSFEPLYNSGGEIDGIMAVGIEVTNQVRARHEIKESELRFRAIADNIPNLAWMARADGYIYWYNKKWFEYTGTTPEQMEGWGWQDVHDPDILPEVMERWQTSLREGKSFDMIFPLKGADGNFRQFLTRILPVYDEAGNISQWFGSNTDITAQVEVQKNLETSEKKFRLLADSLPQHIWTADPNGKLNYFNKSVLDYSGFPLHQLYGEGWLKVVHPDDRDLNVERWNESLTTGKEFVFEHRFRRYDGEYRWQLSRAQPQRDAQGNIQMWVGTSIDIQEQKTFAAALEAEVNLRTRELAKKNNELEQMNKELQSFAYISSHDLQEPLRKIQTFASRITEKEKSNLSDTGIDMFGRMQKAAERMQALIDDLLAYSRTHTSEKDFKPTLLENVINSVKADLAEEIQQKKAIIEDSVSCSLHAITFQMQQLFYNLFTNALKFSKKDTIPRISITSDIQKGSAFNVDGLQSEGRYCHIVFSDNGIGFDPQYNDKIFELFQRLHGKSEYSGTGIGLAIVKKIVENHSGIIFAKGKKNEGACFEIYLPLREHN